LIFICHDCPICNTYAPEFGRLQVEYKGRANFNLVYCDTKLSVGEAREHARQYSLNKLTLLLDPNCRLASFCGAMVTPQAVLFDGKGRRVYSGRIDDRFMALGQQRPSPTSHDLAKALDSVLSHQPPKPASGPPVGCFIVFPKTQ
jgi:hypothetical protein